MDNSTRLLNAFALAMLLAACGLIMHGCAKADIVVVPGNNSSVDEAFGNGRFVQVDRKGRPLINEALVLNNDFLNAFNTISPDLDLSDAAAPVRGEMITTIKALDMADGVSNVNANAVETALLPDVMRIDTTIPGDLTTAAYTRAFNSQGAPIGGRKLEDDAWDLTSKLVIGTTTPDNVPYNRPAAGPGSSNPAIGHQLLNAQATPRGAAVFPYLAPAN